MNVRELSARPLLNHPTLATKFIKYVFLIWRIPPQSPSITETYRVIINKGHTHNLKGICQNFTFFTSSRRSLRNPRSSSFSIVPLLSWNYTILKSDFDIKTSGDNWAQHSEKNSFPIGFFCLFCLIPNGCAVAVGFEPSVVGCLFSLSVDNVELSASYGCSNSSQDSFRVPRFERETITEAGSTRKSNPEGGKTGQHHQHCHLGTGVS